MKNTGFLKQLMNNCDSLLEMRDDIRAEYEQIEGSLSNMDVLLDGLENVISESVRIIEDVEAENIRRDIAWSQKPETQEKEGV